MISWITQTQSTWNSFYDETVVHYASGVTKSFFGDDLPKTVVDFINGKHGKMQWFNRGDSFKPFYYLYE